LNKWVTLTDVYDDWKLISTTWKFLNLKYQLINEDKNTMKKNGYVFDEPIIEFNIHDGSVDINTPTHTLEQGCTINYLVNALKYTQYCIKSS